MSRPSLRDCRLYCILDRSVLAGRDPVVVAERAVQGGADLIQWRDKDSPDGEFLAAARRLREMTRRAGILFVVNDRLDAALSAGADGVHLGHEDFPVREARALVGEEMMIGRSTHSLEEARAAQADGADYIGVGPVFATPTKPGYKAVGLDLIRQVRETIRIPWVAIGGIDLKRLPLVISAGAERVAVVRAVAGAADPKEAARLLKGLMRARHENVH